MQKYDAIVVGLGGMGSAVLYYLARAGAKVVGVDKFSPPHHFGSSHGELRLIRKAYFEHSDYVPLLQSAYRLWDELSEECGQKLLVRTGLLMVGEVDGHVLAGARGSARRHSIPIECISRSQLLADFPQFNYPEKVEGIFEPSGGFLRVENCISAYLALAKGAQIRMNEEVIRWAEGSDHVWVQTPGGKLFADKLVFCSGPWTGELLAKVGLPIQVHEVTQAWFRGPKALGLAAGAPCFAFDHEGAFLYGFPSLDENLEIKVGDHRRGKQVQSPDGNDRRVAAEDLAAISELTGKFLRGVESSPVRASRCFYSMTPDEHFIVDKLPENLRSFVAAGFSGHGFKFASVVGKTLSDWMLNGKPTASFDFLSCSESRFFPKKS